MSSETAPCASQFDSKILIVYVVKMRLSVLILSLFSVASGVQSFAAPCPEGFYFVRSHHRKAYQRADGTHVNATQVSSSCREKRGAFEFWNPKLKDGRPNEWSPGEKTAKWTAEERERVIDALNELPAEFWTPAVEGIYRFSKSKYFPNPGSRIGPNIGLYDTAFDEKRNLARIIAHELAHYSYGKLSFEDGKLYREVTGWQAKLEGRDVYWIPRSNGFVEDDGNVSPDEDYANNIEYFLFEPKVLKRVTPSACKWIKNKFGDKFKIRGIND